MLCQVEADAENRLRQLGFLRVISSGCASSANLLPLQPRPLTLFLAGGRSFMLLRLDTESLLPLFSLSVWNSMVAFGASWLQILQYIRLFCQASCAFIQRTLCRTSTANPKVPRQCHAKQERSCMVVKGLAPVLHLGLGVTIRFISILIPRS